jgi:hypothetical protein
MSIITRELMDEYARKRVEYLNWEKPILTAIWARTGEIWRYILAIDKRICHKIVFANGDDTDGYGYFNPDTDSNYITLDNSYYERSNFRYTIHPYECSFPTVLLWDENWMYTISERIREAWEHENATAEARKGLIQARKDSNSIIRERIRSKLTADEIKHLGL